MATLNILRTLAEQQQFQALKEACLTLVYDQDAAVLILLALAYAHLGQQPLAEQTRQAALDMACDFDATMQVDLAGVYLATRQLDDAEQALKAALQLQPTHALALARLGWCRTQQGQLDAARSLFQQSIQLEPTRLAVFSHLAQLHLIQTEYAQAQQVVHAAWQVLPGLPEMPECVVQQHTAALHNTQLRLWVVTAQFAVAEAWLQTQSHEAVESHAQWVMLYAELLAEHNAHDEAEDSLRDCLKQYPENVDVYLQLANLAYVQGHFQQARHLLRQALKLAPEHIALWVKLCGVDLRITSVRARQAAEKAVALAEALVEDDPTLVQLQRAQAKSALAQVESHEQHIDTAEHLFREVLAASPDFVPALQGLGELHIQQGRIEDAIVLFERIKQIDPVKGHIALIHARQFPEDEGVLAHLERAARVPSLAGPVSANILFHLASAWQKRQAYDKAFAFAAQANQACRKFLSYDRQTHRDSMARVRMRFSPALYEHRAGSGIETTLPVYVLGMPRSGTTLIEQVLSGHSQIFGAGELSVIPQVIQGLNRWERHAGSGRSFPDCVDDLSPRVAQGIAQNVLTELQAYAPAAKHIVDKLPHNFEHIGLIKFLFPQAKIISVRRDPRDIALSNYFTHYQAQHGGMGFAYDLTDIGQQLADHNLLMHHWHQVFPGELLELHYEDVVDDLEGCARKMLDYIGVAWEPNVLKFNELDRPIKTASMWQVRQPLYRTAKGKWRHYAKHLAPLTTGTNAKIESPAYDMLTLPEPGFLSEGVECYRQQDLDGAERHFKKMLHHCPEHAACNYMLGLVYLHKGYLQAGIESMQRALDKAPWHKEWQDNLAKAKAQASALDQRDTTTADVNDALVEV